MAIEAENEDWAIGGEGLVEKGRTRLWLSKWTFCLKTLPQPPIGQGQNPGLRILFFFDDSALETGVGLGV